MLVKRLRPRMSASDSDNSIDWLASDDEDNESEPELSRSRTPAQTPPPLSSRSPGLLDHSEGGSPYSESKEEEEEEEEAGGWGGSGEDSGRGSPASRTAETWESHAGVGLRRSERSKGRKTQQAHKRPHSPAGAEHKERPLLSNQLEKSRFFTTKCMELQCYILPLSSILNGLRTGRYRERLSSFQESVAMDRIQRIMGVLQKPCMGERYVNIIFKMEEMLKSWFPNIKPREEHTVAHTEEPVPIKRPKLSASSTDSPFTVNTPTAGAKAPRVSDLAPTGAAHSASNVKRLHSAPSGLLPAEQGQQGPPAWFPSSRALTQDSAVSSSTDGGRAKTDSALVRPRPAKINAPCLERLLKSTESIIGRGGAAVGGVTGGSCS